MAQSVGRAQQVVSITQPRALRTAALAADLVDDLAQPARNEGLIWQSQLGTPVDHQITELLDQPAARQLSVEHDDYVAERGRVLIEQSPPSRHVNGLADAVQDDLVPRGEQLDAADAWDDRKIKINSKISDRLDDADRGVVEGRIAQTRKPIVPPSPTSARMISASLSSGLMPRRHASPIVRSVALSIGSPLRVWHFDETIVIMGDQRPADLLAQTDEVVLCRPLSATTNTSTRFSAATASRVR